tara:strand:- start:94 stop:201 length:108 start_codon:yes stop_codon:yes gene_type:complete
MKEIKTLEQACKTKRNIACVIEHQAVSIQKADLTF